jgi:RNA polymerase sigma-70 factor, ECF subfamily
MKMVLNRILIYDTVDKLFVNRENHLGNCDTFCPHHTTKLISRHLMKVQPTFNEDEIIKSARAGKLESFSLLYELYLPVVYKRVRYTVPPEDVEDLTQEIFITVIRSIHGFRGESKFGTWLRTLTNRQIADYYRRRHEPEVGLIDEHKAPENLATSDEMIILRQAIVRLPEKYREIIYLRFVEEKPFSEIATQTGRSLEAVKSLFRRAVIALDKLVKS